MPKDKKGEDTEVWKFYGYIGLHGKRIDECASTQEILDKVPSSYVQNRIKRDGDHNHITVLIKSDINALLEKLPNSKYGDAFKQLKTKHANKKDRDVVLLLCKEVIEIDWKPLGVGKVSQLDPETKEEQESYFVVVEWPSCQQFLNEFGIQRDFHITVGFKHKDVHGVKKDKTTLL